MKVKEFIQKYYPEEWEKSQRGEKAEVDLMPEPEELIYKCWECGESDCPTGVHLSGWKVVLQYTPEEGWAIMQVGDAYCSKMFDTYVPDNWDYELLLDISEKELLKMEMDELWRKVEEAFGVKMDELDEHNEEQIRKYEEMLEEVGYSNKAKS